jgi:hypothetical protein
VGFSSLSDLEDAQPITIRLATVLAVGRDAAPPRASVGASGKGQ